MAPLNQARSTLDRLMTSRLGQFLARYGADRADEHAALIAFSALFSIFPLIGALLTLLGLLIRDDRKLADMVEVVNRLFPSQLADLLGFLQETKQLTGLLGIVSLAGLLWSASAIFGSLAQAFNVFYRVKDRGFIRQKLMAFTMIFVFLGLILLSVVAASAATFLLGFSAERSPIPLPGLGPLQSLLGWAISLGSALLLFLAVFRIVPNARLSFGQVWKGAVLSAVLFTLINQLFPLYLRFFGGGFAAYKTLGLFLLLMTWFYFLARILVLGCELNAFLSPLPAAERAGAEKRKAEGAGGRETEPDRAGARREAAGTLLRLGAVAAAALLIVQRLRRHG